MNSISPFQLGERNREDRGREEGREGGGGERERERERERGRERDLRQTDRQTDRVHSEEGEESRRNGDQVQIRRKGW